MWRSGGAIEIEQCSQGRSRVKMKFERCCLPLSTPKPLLLGARTLLQGLLALLLGASPGLTTGSKDATGLVYFRTPFAIYISIVASWCFYRIQRLEASSEIRAAMTIITPCVPNKPSAHWHSEKSSRQLGSSMQFMMHWSVLTSNKCHASSNRCLTSSNKKLVGTSATLVVTSALLVVTSATLLETIS